MFSDFVSEILPIVISYYKTCINPDLRIIFASFLVECICKTYYILVHIITVVVCRRILKLAMQCNLSIHHRFSERK